MKLQLIISQLRRWAMAIAIVLIGSCGLSLQAQTHDHEHGECLLIVPEQPFVAGAKQMPSKFGAEPTTGLIRNTNLVYKVRLATLIDPTYLKVKWFPEYSHDLRGNKENIERVIEAWWTDLEKKLNEYYRASVGVEFTIVRDKRLILYDYADINNRVNNALDMMTSRKYIDSLLGDTKVYDLGLVIGDPRYGRAGAAQLGSAIGPSKGAIVTWHQFTTVAHEIGHSLGADHTHYKDDSNNTEPGAGTSIMSYGSPRNFFALISIQEMRRYLASWSYYKDEARTQFVQRETDDDSAPYAYEEQGTTPALERDAMKSIYTITRGSNFQFYLPVTTESTGNYYSVHPYDISRNDKANSNTLRPAYKETQDSCVMFEPRYIDPAVVKEDKIITEPYSDQTKLGLFTFIAGVRNHSRYDSKELKLNIVEGEPFKINSFGPAGSSTLTRYMPGQECVITWTPCTELYGADSKVRILLSDDAGISYKYVLADNVANTGNYKFVFPYVKIGRGNFHGWSMTENGGRIKIEVVGEAAYAIYPEGGYVYGGASGSASIGYTFEPTEQRYAFRPVNSADQLPEVFVRVNSLNEIPKAVSLEAYRPKNTATKYPSTHKDEVFDTWVRRTYTADCAGTKYYYVQCFFLPDKITDSEKLKIEVDRIKDLALVLNENIGKLGYPKSWLAESKNFKTAYQRVFNGEVYRTDATEDDVIALNEALTALANISDNDVVMPEEGKYYHLRFYLNPNGFTKYYYLKETNEGQFMTADSTEATRWRCYVKDGKYHFVSDRGKQAFDDNPYEGTTERNMQFDNFNNGGLERKLERGFSWGSFTLLNSQHYGASLNVNGNFVIIRGPLNVPMMPEQRVNCGGFILSTDFQPVALKDEAYNSGTDSLLTAIGNGVQAVQEGNLTWYTQPGTGGVNVVYVKGQFTPNENGRVSLEVPATIGGQSVVGIVAQKVTTNARYDNKYTYNLPAALRGYDFDLKIPASVATIGEDALSKNDNLYNVEFLGNSSLTTIGKEAFADAKNMRFAKVALTASSLAQIGDSAFRGTALRALTLKAPATALRAKSFGGSKSLEYLDLREATGTTALNRETIGLSKHTLVFVNNGTMAVAGEANVVIYNGTTGTCQHLALYDYTVNDKGVATTYGISIPQTDSDQGTTDATFTASRVSFDRNFAEGFGTLCLPFNLALPSGMKAYTFQERTTEDGQTVYSFVGASSIQANTPYLINCTAGTTISDQTNVVINPATRYTIGNEVTATTSPSFAGTLSELSHSDALGKSVFILNQGNWRRIYDYDGTINKKGIVLPYRAFFLDSFAPKRLLARSFVNELTGIGHLSTLDSRPNTQQGIYAIDGRYVGNSLDALPKGIYIINGQKFLKQ